MTLNLKENWREAFFWALVVALALELIFNAFAQHTVWHRMTTLEHKVEQLEHPDAR